MRQFVKSSLSALLGVSLLTISSFALAEDDSLPISLRVEPGVAVPITDPQAQRFNVGGALAVKPELGLGSYFSLGPSASVISLPSKVSNVDAGTAWGFGGFVRVKRPHDSKNTDTGFAAVSPWVDADLLYVSTGSLDRAGFAAAVGASVPTSGKRTLWVGPFARYESVHQEDGFRINGNSSKTIIFGLSFEIGAGVDQKIVHQPCPPVQANKLPEQQPVPVKTTGPTSTDVELHQVVQFAWDSPVLDAKANSQLTDVLTKLASVKDFKSIKVEGHASSEGQSKHNDALSLKRAQAVVDYLVANGLPKEKLSAVGFGSSVPVASNANVAGRVLNRRAEFVVKFVIVKQSK
jgi:outer membrane protein OmpA-like peptidoglycan-associated protein